MMEKRLTVFPGHSRIFFLAVQSNLTVKIVMTQVPDNLRPPTTFKCIN